MPLKQMGKSNIAAGVVWYGVFGMGEQKVHDEGERSKGKVEDREMEQIMHNAPTF